MKHIQLAYNLHTEPSVCWVYSILFFKWLHKIKSATSRYLFFHLFFSGGSKIYWAIMARELGLPWLQVQQKAWLPFYNEALTRINGENRQRSSLPFISKDTKGLQGDHWRLHGAQMDVEQCNRVPLLSMDCAQSSASRLSSSSVVLLAAATPKITQKAHAADARWLHVPA